MNKKVLIGLGVLAVAGIGFYMWKKKKDEKSSESETKPEEKANARGGRKRLVAIISSSKSNIYDKNGNLISINTVDAVTPRCQTGSGGNITNAPCKNIYGEVITPAMLE